MKIIIKIKGVAHIGHTQGKDHKEYTPMPPDKEKEQWACMINKSMGQAKEHPGTLEKWQNCTIDKPTRIHLAYTGSYPIV